MITIAIAKGRMQESALSLLSRAGICVSEEAVNSRRLALTDETGQYRFIFVKPADVPVYVEHGIADCGVVGRDVLLETEADLLLPLDLGIARCRIVVAAADPEAMTNDGNGSYLRSASTDAGPSHSAHSVHTRPTASFVPAGRVRGAQPT